MEPMATDGSGAPPLCLAQNGSRDAFRGGGGFVPRHGRKHGSRGPRPAPALGPIRAAALAGCAGRAGLASTKKRTLGKRSSGAARTRRRRGNIITALGKNRDDELFEYAASAVSARAMTGVNRDSHMCIITSHLGHYLLTGADSVSARALDQIRKVGNYSPTIRPVGKNR